MVYGILCSGLWYNCNSTITGRGEFNRSPLFYMITARTKRITWKHKHPNAHKIMGITYDILVWLVIWFCFFSCAVVVSWLMQEDIEWKNNYYQEQSSEMATK